MDMLFDTRTDTACSFGKFLIGMAIDREKMNVMEKRKNYNGYSHVPELYHRVIIFQGI